MIHFAIRRKSLYLAIALVVCIIAALIAMLVVSNMKHDEQQIPDGQIEVSELQVSSWIDGRLLELCVEAGDYVNVGDTLAVIDICDSKKDTVKYSQPKDDSIDERINNSYLILQHAKAGLAIAEKSYHNMQKLYDDGVVSEEVLNSALTNYKLMEGQVMAVQNSLKMLQTDNGETAIVAQVKGEIGDVYLKEGNLLCNGTPIMSVFMMDDIWGAFSIDKSDNKKFNIGDIIVAYVPAFDKELEMQIYDIDDKVLEASDDNKEQHYSNNKLKFKARPVKETEGLRPGMLLIIKD